jgi:hypothetical protein
MAPGDGDMKAHSRSRRTIGVALAAAVVLAASVRAHHSFAMYDMKAIRVFTGVVTRVDPAANHLQMYFAPMNAERKNVERDAKGEPIIWTVEMGQSGQMARQGISVNTFPAGTVFSVGLHPLRSGQPAGARQGGLFKCPGRTPPAPGKHCDSVPGHTAIGNEPLAAPTK